MKWASSLSLEPTCEDAVSACVLEIEERMGDQIPDLLIVFVSPHHQAAFDDLGSELMSRLGVTRLIGCMGGGIVGNANEAENRPALSVTAASLPGVSITQFHVTQNDLPDPTRVHELELELGENPQIILLPDPYSIQSELLVKLFDMAWPASPKVGGLASGAMFPGGSALFLDNRIYREGAVGLGLSGNVVMDTIVAQGCRPIGGPMFITRCQENILQELNSRSPRQVLQEIYDDLPESDRQLFRHSLFLGIEMTFKEEAYQQGDFLIRNLLGMQQDTGYLEIGAYLQETAIAQFHLRDAVTSREDLDQHLMRHRNRVETVPSGALMFSCLGRGEGLYGTPNHDAHLFRSRLGATTLGGFFCNGEIGPVAGQTHLHGYTSSFGLFRPAEDRDFDRGAEAEKARPLSP